jgi:hypothetical protein
LTKEYLAGKRKSQVSPVQLYIFVSFVTFFLPSILPDVHKKDSTINSISVPDIDSLNFANDYKGVSMFGLENVKSIAELDSIQRTLSQETKLSFFKYSIYEKSIIISQWDINKKRFIESIYHNFSKFIFLYMPVFAFWLWVFHSKKKWLYFDHGVYTLHYFSLILLLISLYILIHWVISFFHPHRYVSIFLVAAMTFYFIYYFFLSHHKMYGQSRAKSHLICIALFIINTFFMFIVFALFSVAVVWFSAI